MARVRLLIPSAIGKHSMRCPPQLLHPLSSVRRVDLASACTPPRPARTTAAATHTQAAEDPKAAPALFQLPDQLFLSLRFLHSVKETS